MLREAKTIRNRKNYVRDILIYSPYNLNYKGDSFERFKRLTFRAGCRVGY